MRLCFIANPNSIHTQRWTRYFAERGHEIHLIGVRAAQEALLEGVALYDLTASTNIRKLRYLAWTPRVRRLVREIQPDVLHAHQVANAGWLGAASGYHPLLVTAWGSDLLVGPARSWAQRRLARWVLQQADYMICVSHSLARAARSMGMDPARLEVAIWGVDTSTFHPAPADQTLRAQLGLGPGPIVLSIRAVRPVYNPLDIARAIPRVVEQVPDAQFVIRSYTHDPDLLAQFQAIIQQHHLTESVHYVGSLPDERAIASLYRLADVAVSVPSSDGIPLSVLEALACGNAMVLSDVPSLHEWVRDQQEGLFVPIGDVQAISAAIVRLLQDKALRRQLQTKGVELIQRRADSRVWMARAEDLYQRIALAKSIETTARSPHAKPE